MSNPSGFYRQTDPLPAGYGSHYSPHQNELAFTQVHQTKPVYQPQPPPQQETIIQPSKPIQTAIPQYTQSPPPKKLSYLIDWVVCVVPLFYIIAILILMVCLQTIKIRHLNPEPAHSTMLKLTQNLKTPPIVDITNMPERHSPHSSSLHTHFLTHDEVAGDCPQGYEKAAIGAWEGIHSGCLCDDGEVRTRAYCAIHFSSDKCKSVKSLDPDVIAIWKGKKYCVKHAAHWKWVAGVSCAAGEKNCGSNICVPNDDPCPLTELEENSAGTILIGSKKFKGVRGEGLPLVNFELVPGEASNSECFNKDLGPQFQSKKFYPLSRVPQKGCDDYKSLHSYTTSLDTEKLSVVHTQNELRSKLDEVPFYNSYTAPDDTYNFVVVERIEIKNQKECGTIHPDEVESVTSKSQRIYNFERNITVVILIICAVVVLLAPVLYVLRKKVFSAIDFNEHHQAKFYALVAIIVVVLCLILGFIYLTDVDGADGLKETNKRFEVYKKHECFVDQGLKKAVEDVDHFALHSYASTYSWVVAAFYLSIAFIIILILLVIYQYSVHGEMFANPWKDRSIDQFKYERYN